MALTALSLCVAALVALGGIAQQWAAAAMFPWWLAGAALWTAALGWEWWRVRRLGLTVAVLAPTMRLGRNGELALAFRADGQRPQTLEFVAALPAGFDSSREAVRVVIPAGGEGVCRVAVRPTQLGQTPWPRLPTRVRGPLGLAWWAKACPLDVRLVVSPDFRMASAYAGNTPTGVNRHRHPGGGSELDHLRGYQPGDPRRAIDWKATARTGEPVTRVTREEEHLAVMLVVDAGRSSATRLDGLNQLGHFVNAASRLAEQASSYGDEVGLVAVADRPLAAIAPGRDLGVVQRLRSALMSLEVQPVETDLVAAAMLVRRLVPRRCLVVLLTDLYGQSGGGRLVRSIRLWVPKHLPLVAGLVAADVDALGRARAETWLDPYYALAADDYRRALVATANGLRRLGAHPVICRAAALDATLLARYRTLKVQRRV